VTRVTTLGEMTASIAHEVNSRWPPSWRRQRVAELAGRATPDLDRLREARWGDRQDGHRAAEVIMRVRQLATRSAPQKIALDVNERGA